MERKRLSSQSCAHSTTRLRDHFERSNRIGSTSHNSQWLCQSTKTKLPVGMCTANVTEKSSDSGKNVCNSGISQQVISSTKAGEKMAPSNRSQCSQQSFNSSNIQNGNRRGDKKLHLQRGVGSFCRSYRRVFSHSYSPKISKPTSVSCLHAEEHNLLLFTDASVKGWGAHLGDLTVSGLWSDRETNLHINILELKAVFLAIRSFQTHLLNKRVLVASDNSTVVAYLNKQGGTHSLEMCLMLWRLMAFCHPRAILLRARHIQGCLNVIADSLSRRDKVIQTEWSLHPKIFLRICQIWHKPMIDLFATRMNNKLPLYVSPVPDPNAMAVDALNISWEAMDGYVYCPIALIPKVVQKMRSYACQMIVVAPGWPGMSWFWDLIDLSTKPPLFLPHWEWLLKQPFSQKFHQNLPYLSLHVWHLDSRPNHLKNSQAQWQRELRHLRDFHPEGSMNQGGPFLNHGVKRSRWNSNNHLFPQ